MSVEILSTAVLHNCNINIRNKSKKRCYSITVRGFDFDNQLDPSRRFYRTPTCDRQTDTDVTIAGIALA